MNAISADANALESSEGLVSIKPSPIQGKGLFATRPVSRGTRILEYTGEKISKAESLRRCEVGNVCLFALDGEHDLDGDVPWNLARFLNHSCAPNCEALPVQGRVWFVATRDIAANEELTFNYGYDLTDYREHPCRCGASDCVGFMVAEEFFDHVRRQNAP